MAIDALPEAASDEIRKWAVVFDFDTDSCYPSAAISPKGEINPGLDPGGIDWSYVKECRGPAQLSNSNTYHRAAMIRKDGNLFVVRMYALYFMKDRDSPVGNIFGHTHDWEFALVWLTNGVLTHAAVSAHTGVDKESVGDLTFDAGAPNSVKVVYHKNSATTHCMRFAGTDESPENEAGKWITPPIVDWHTMRGDVSNETLRTLLNTHSFGEADCSVNDKNFPYRICQEIPEGYPPSADEWKAAAHSIPLDVAAQVVPKHVPIEAASTVAPKGVPMGIASKLAPKPK